MATDEFAGNGAEMQAPASTIAIHGPNRVYGTYTVELIMMWWDYSMTVVQDVNVTCARGLHVIERSIDELADRAELDGRIVLTASDGETLVIDNSSDDDDWEDRIRRMIVSARLIGYKPPTLNEVRARNGAAPVADGDKPLDRDADDVANRLRKAGVTDNG